MPGRSSLCNARNTYFPAARYNNRMQGQSQDFVGTKIALIYGDALVTIQRDDVPGLRFAGLWDFPGGGRESGETPFDCAAREVREELGLQIRQNMVKWTKAWPAMHDASLAAFFMVADISRRDVESIVLGDEGQDWRLMTHGEFFERDDVVPDLKPRLRDYLASLSR